VVDGEVIPLDDSGSDGRLKELVAGALKEA